MVIGLDLFASSCEVTACNASCKSTWAVGVRSLLIMIVLVVGSNVPANSRPSVPIKLDSSVTFVPPSSSMAKLTALATLATSLFLLRDSISSASTNLPSRRSSTTSGSSAIEVAAKALAGNGSPRSRRMLF